MIAVCANINAVRQLPAVTGHETYVVGFPIGNFTETMHRKFELSDGFYFEVFVHVKVARSV